MTKDALLRKLDAMLDDVRRGRTYGNIEIEFRAGEPVFIRKTEQEKLDETENRNHAEVRRY